MKIQNLTYKLNGKILIDNLNLQSDNWLFFVYWPSGTWKTTLLKILAKLIKPTNWKVLVEEKMWFFWQDYNLLDLDIKSNLALPFLLYNKKINLTWKKYLFDYFNINYPENTKIERLSSWEKERIWIIKAFIHKPDLILLDEVGNSLDENLKIKLLKFLLDYSQKNIIFLVSHDYYFKINLCWKLIYDKNFKIYKI